MIASPQSPELVVRHFYVDEAGIGDPDKEPYTVVAGVMLNVDEQYAPLQKYLLDMADEFVAPGLERPLDFAFHAKDLWHGSGFFPRDDWSLEKRLEILNHLADIPQKFELPIIYSCVDRSNYPPNEPTLGSAKRFFKAARAKANKKCHTICFVSCLSQVERWMEHNYKDEKVFVVAELHEDHKDYLLAVAQLLSNPRARSTIENDPNIDWPALTHVVEEPLFVRKLGSSPVQVADVCAFILARALAGGNHVEPLLEKIRPNLVSGFRREFVKSSSREISYPASSA